MAVNIATLAIKFVADTTGIKSGVNGVVGSLGKLITGAAIGAAAFGAVNKAIDAFSASAERIDSMSKVADRLGTSFETIQAAALGAKMAGLGLEDLTQAIDHMSKKIGSGGMSLDQRFLQQAEAIAAIKDPAEQARAAMDLFGKSGAKLLPLLKQGGKAFKEAADLIKRFDLGISDIDARNVEKMNDAWSKLNFILEATTDKIVARLSPAIEHLLNTAIDGTEKWSDKMRTLGVDPMTLLNQQIFNLTTALDRMNSELLLGAARWESMIKVASGFGVFGGAGAWLGARLAEAGKPGGKGSSKKLGEFGGMETRLRGTGAAKDSQEAARIINAGTTNLTAAEKAAIESARHEREMKLILEKTLNMWMSRPPMVLGVASF